MINTYPIGATSRKINFSLLCAENSSRRPTYIHIMALVGRIAQANAATATPHSLETERALLGETLIQGQQYMPTRVRTVSKLFDNVRVKQKNINQFTNCEKSCHGIKYTIFSENIMICIVLIKKIYFYSSFLHG